MKNLKRHHLGDGVKNLNFVRAAQRQKRWNGPTKFVLIEIKWNKT